MKRKAEAVADQSNSLLVTCIKPSTHWIGQRLLPLFALWCKKLVCSTTARHCCWIFVPGRLFLEVERVSVSAHRAIFSHRLQYGSHRTGGAIDTPTRSATKHPLNYGIGNESCELNHLIQTSVAVNAVLISTWKVSFDLATKHTFGCIWHHLVSTCLTSLSFSYLVMKRHWLYARLYGYDKAVYYRDELFDSFSGHLKNVRILQNGIGNKKFLQINMYYMTSRKIVNAYYCA